MNESQPTSVINLSAAIQQELVRLRSERTRIEQSLARQRIELEGVEERLVALSGAAALYPEYAPVSVPFLQVLEALPSPPATELSAPEPAILQRSETPAAAEIRKHMDAFFARSWEEKAARGLAKVGLDPTQQAAVVGSLLAESSISSVKDALQDDVLLGFASPDEVDPVKASPEPPPRPESLSTPVSDRAAYKPVHAKRSKISFGRATSDDAAAIDAFIREQGVSKCPAGFVGESSGKISPEDRAAIAAHAKRQQELASQKPVKGSWSKSRRVAAAQ